MSLTDVIVRVTVGSNTYSTSALATSSGLANVTLGTITGSTANYVVASGSGTYLTYDTTITIHVTGSSTTPSLSTIALIYTPSGGDIAGPENV